MLIKNDHHRRHVSGEYSIALQRQGRKQTLTQAHVDDAPSADDDALHNKFPFVVGADGSLQMFDIERGVRLVRQCRDNFNYIYIIFF